MSMIGGGFFGLPGISAVLENTENQIWWGRYQWQRLRSDVIYSASVDAGADPTTLLRTGLIMGKATSGAASGMLKPWSPVATDGSQFIYGVLIVDQSMISRGSSVENKWFAYCLVGGTLKAKSLYVAKASNAIGLTTYAEEFFVRQALTNTGRFQLDDLVGGSSNGWHAYKHASLMTDPTAYTLLSGDNNTLCIGDHSALTTYTLPAPKMGLRFGFYALTNTGIAVQAATNGDLLWYNDAAANKVTFSTNLKTIGTYIIADCIPTTTSSTFTPKWAVQFVGAVDTAGAAVLPVVAT